MAIDVLKDFRLVGGTALALQIGHRISVDLDLFGQSQLTGEDIQFHLANFDDIRPMSSSISINIMAIQGVKVDFVNYRYPFISPMIVHEQIRLAGLADIAAMKFAAIVGRGKKRDFFDLYFLLEHFSLEQIIGFYEQKYPDGSIFLVARSLVYFDDAEHDDPVQLLNKKVSWEQVKKRLIQEARRVF